MDLYFPAQRKVADAQAAFYCRLYLGDPDAALPANASAAERDGYQAARLLTAVPDDAEDTVKAHAARNVLLHGMLDDDKRKFSGLALPDVKLAVIRRRTRPPPAPIVSPALVERAWHLVRHVGRVLRQFRGVAEDEEEAEAPAPPPAPAPAPAAAASVELISLSRYDLALAQRILDGLGIPAHGPGGLIAPDIPAGPWAVTSTITAQIDEIIGYKGETIFSAIHRAWDRPLVRLVVKGVPATVLSVLVIDYLSRLYNTDFGASINQTPTHVLYNMIQELRHAIRVPAFGSMMRKGPTSAATAIWRVISEAVKKGTHDLYWNAYYMIHPTVRDFLLPKIGGAFTFLLAPLVTHLALILLIVLLVYQLYTGGLAGVWHTLARVGLFLLMRLLSLFVPHSMMKFMDNGLLSILRAVCARFSDLAAETTAPFYLDLEAGCNRHALSFVTAGDATAAHVVEAIMESRILGGIRPRLLLRLERPTPVEYEIKVLTHGSATPDGSDPLVEAWVDEDLASGLSLPRFQNVPFFYYTLFRLERAIVANPFGPQWLMVRLPNNLVTAAVKHGCAKRPRWIHPTQVLWMWTSPLQALNEMLDAIGGLDAGWPTNAVAAARLVARDFQCALWGQHPWLRAPPPPMMVALDTHGVSLTGRLERSSAFTTMWFQGFGLGLWRPKRIKNLIPTRDEQPPTRRLGQDAPDILAVRLAWPQEPPAAVMDAMIAYFKALGQVFDAAVEYIIAIGDREYEPNYIMLEDIQG